MLPTSSANGDRLIFSGVHLLLVTHSGDSGAGAGFSGSGDLFAARPNRNPVPSARPNRNPVPFYFFFCSTPSNKVSFSDLANLTTPEI
ncbi:hypothetical protein MRB53_009970 [Persea americana]|uniref:Uncharacterized protein n=1 Tax=Persea americana TaxID=3435 RepID=A0ACC2LR93_PERAE|nr:hypothetical protein MRB53_009970 [Persea americana]